MLLNLDKKQTKILKESLEESLQDIERQYYACYGTDDNCLCKGQKKKIDTIKSILENLGVKD